MKHAEIVKAQLAKIRSTAPLVHNITNYVVMNNSANALLALGASPVMAHAPEEMDDFLKIDSSLVVNIGTLSRPWIDAMKQAMTAAKRESKPVVLDPVGAGATAFRTDTVKTLLDAAVPAVIRGNASEIMALKDAAVKTKGVDSSVRSDQALDAAQTLAKELGCTVCISGETDYITDGKRTLTVSNGSELMTRVTGLGCTASALCGAFAAVSETPLEAAFGAMAIMGIAGEKAAAAADGPGTLQLHFLDALYSLSEDDIPSSLKSAEL